MPNNNKEFPNYAQMLSENLNLSPITADERFAELSAERGFTDKEILDELMKVSDRAKIAGVKGARQAVEKGVKSAQFKAEFRAHQQREARLSSIKALTGFVLLILFLIPPIATFTWLYRQSVELYPLPGNITAHCEQRGCNKLATRSVFHISKGENQITHRVGEPVLFCDEHTPDPLVGGNGGLIAFVTLGVLALSGFVGLSVFFKIMDRIK